MWFVDHTIYYIIWININAYQHCCLNYTQVYWILKNKQEKILNFCTVKNNLTVSTINCRDYRWGFSQEFNDLFIKHFIDLINIYEWLERIKKNIYKIQFYV